MKKITIPLIVGIALSVAIAIKEKVFCAVGLKQIFMGLSDSFFVPGVLLAGFGIMRLVVKSGAFDVMTYGISEYVNMRIRSGFLKSKYKHKDINEYVEEKRRKREKKDNSALFAGAGFIFVSVIFALLFSSI